MRNWLKRGVVVWGAVGATLLAWVALAAGVNAGTSSEVKEARTQAAMEIHFYQVVAGELSGSEASPANRLARDLREASIDRLHTFQGDSNRYGGITEELGFDPFNGEDCNECGPLDSEVILNTERAKTGDVFGVIEEIQDEIPVQDEMPGPPAAIWLLWFLSLPTAVGVVYVRERKSVEARYREFGEERHLIERLRREKEALPPGGAQWLELDNLQDQIQEQIDARVGYRTRKSQEVRLEELTREATGTLESLDAGTKTLD